MVTRLLPLLDPMIVFVQALMQVCITGRLRERHVLREKRIARSCYSSLTTRIAWLFMFLLAGALPATAVALEPLRYDECR